MTWATTWEALSALSMVRLSVSLLPTQSSPVVGWNARVRGIASCCAAVACTTAVAAWPNAGAHVPSPVAGASEDGPGAVGAGSIAGHGCEMFLRSASTAVSMAVGWSAMEPSTACSRMQWSSTAYDGWICASKSRYTRSRERSSTMYGHCVLLSLPVMLAQASHVPSLTPFLSEERKATLPGYSVWRSFTICVYVGVSSRPGVQPV